MSKQQKAKRFIPNFDLLESRLVLDGNVALSLHKGVLSVVGDAEANQISIASDASGNVTVTSTDGITTLNGEAGPLTFSGVTNGLSVNMGDGDDAVDITGERSKKDVSINMGNGNNTLTIEGMYVKKNLTITSGSGDDSLSLNFVNVSKQLTINAGDGNNTVTLDTIAAGRNSSLRTGSGDDTITITDSMFSPHATLNAGAGDDQVTIVDNVFGEDATVDGGPGNDTLVVVGNRFGKHERQRNFETISTSLAPQANNDTVTVAAGGMVSIDVAANDKAIVGTLDLGSIVIVQQPTNGNVVVNGDGTVTYTNTNVAATTDTFSYTIADSEGHVSNVATVAVAITAAVGPIQTAPVANNDVFNVLRGTATTLSILANDTDADNDINPASVVIVGQSANGATISVNADGTISYNITTPGVTTDTFTYTVKDMEGLISNIATVTLNIMS